MIITCNCGEKKFTLPDNSIPAAGRMVQCGFCGLKWKQFPVGDVEKTQSIARPKKVVSRTQPVQKKAEKEKNRQIKKKITTNKQKKRKNKKNDISTFSQEYLNKKYGIYIKEPLKNNKQIKQEKIKSKSLGFGFYGILLLILIFFTTFLGILNLTKEILIFNFPYLENYINYFYETINNLSIIIKDFFNYY